MGRTVAAVAAVVGQLLVLVFLYVPAGLVVPGAAYVLLNVLGLALGALCVWLALRRSPVALAVPPAAAVLWLGYVQAGSALFGWTA